MAFAEHSAGIRLRLLSAQLLEKILSQVASKGLIPLDLVRKICLRNSNGSSGATPKHTLSNEYFSPCLLQPCKVVAVTSLLARPVESYPRGPFGSLA